MILINVGVFLVLNVFLQLVMVILYGAQNFEYPYKMIMHQFAIPPSFEAFMLKPWTLFTYMFVHGGFGHIFSNMLFLFWFGSFFRDVAGSRGITPVYVLGGLVGGLVYLIYTQLAHLTSDYPFDPSLKGASAGVTAIIVASAVTAPYYRVFIPFIGPVKIMYLAGITLVLSLLSIPFNNTGGHFSHLGGAAFGYFYVVLANRGTNIGDIWYRFMNKFNDWFSPNSSRPRPKVAYRNPAHAKAKAPAGGNFGRSAKAGHATDNRINQERIDAILEKIKQSGYSSLTEEEKEYLFKASKEQ